MTLHDLELRYGFRYPALYHRLGEQGRLDYGTYGRAWQSDVLTRLLERPPFLLLGDDYEGLDPDDVAEALEDLHAPDDYRAVPHETILVPIGRTGAGDLYCLDVRGPGADQGADDGVPVVLAWHDADELTTVARSLTDLTFVALLGAARRTDDAHRVTSRENQRRVLLAHADLLGEERTALIAGVLGRPFLPEGVGLLTDGEHRELVLAEVGIAPDDAPSRPYWG